MTNITISDKSSNKGNLLYIQQSLTEITNQTGTEVTVREDGQRAVMTFYCNEYFKEVIKAETADKVAEIIAVKYKYDYYKENVLTAGLKKDEREILLACLIAADLEDDKKYSFERVKKFDDLAIDGLYNFMLSGLRKKWTEVVGYIPKGFTSTQLNDFVGYLLENKRRRCYVDDGKVYDCHYRRLKRTDLMDGEKLKIIREILLSNSGEIEINGVVPEEDEYYMKAFYKDKIYFSDFYTS